MELLRESDKKARKNHICNVCGELIKKGDVYSSQTCVEDGEIITFKSHLDCAEYFDSVNNEQELLESESEFLEYLKEDKNKYNIKTDSIHESIKGILEYRRINKWNEQ